MSSINDIIHNILNTNNEIFILIGAFILYLYEHDKNNTGLFINLVTLCFVIALFDVILKKIILFDVKGDYYKFIANSVITIITINLLFYIINNSTDKITFQNLFNTIIAILFYEVIIFKLFNYNNILDCKLRNITKIIMRLATVHILTNYLNDKPYDQEWFNFAFAQIFNFSLSAVMFQ